MGPESFRDYLSSNGFDPRDFRTASEIFIDSKRDLGRTLRENQTMALRAGSAPDGTGTQFALVRVEGGLDDFFINEQQFDQRIDDRLDLRSGSSDYAELSQQTRDMLLA